MILKIENIIRNGLLFLQSFISYKALIIILTIGAFILFVRFSKIDKISIKKIIKEHLNSLKSSNSSNGTLNLTEAICFFIFPFVFAVLFAWKKVLNEQDINTVITIFSIFTGLLFNLLILILDMVRKIKDMANNENDANSYNIRRTLLKETYANISFCIVLSLVLLSFSFVFVIGVSKWLFKYILSVLVYYCIITFILTLFMVLKRIYSLLSHEFK
ncbi:hypothetical protein IAI10_09955 [Clostridium sp. 19966]|uniref:hypothetical protein n=1 Tax=Clostridium sp. 19966 TaxID=2768166 RepID=UPI0028DF056E|nr:hypothetical protein [Clostridium sp. 19966]MDT8716981.1 hypothetical protein [Clostridium sp. 19966]